MPTFNVVLGTLFAPQVGPAGMEPRPAPTRAQEPGGWAFTGRTRHEPSRWRARPTTNASRPSDVIDALIRVLHQARDELVFHDVPRRGK